MAEITASLVKELRDESGEIVRRYGPRPMRRVVSKETASALTSMMERVTTEGTASRLIFVPGYKTAGKTGTAQKAVPGVGYRGGKMINSFVGFLPSRKPEFVILVMADEPASGRWGSTVCGPSYTEIASRAMLTGCGRNAMRQSTREHPRLAGRDPDPPRRPHTLAIRRLKRGESARAARSPLAAGRDAPRPPGGTSAEPACSRPGGDGPPGADQGG